MVSSCEPPSLPHCGDTRELGCRPTCSPGSLSSSSPCRSSSQLRGSLECLLPPPYGRSSPRRIAFFVIGSSRIVSVGADSTIAPLFAAAVARLATAGSPHAFALTSLTALVTGGIVLVVGFLRLGWIADFLSIPIITGFMVGVAITIVVHQLPDILGEGSASGSLVHRIHVLFSHLGSVNSWSLGIGLVVFVVMVGAEKIDRRIPAALIGMVGSTVLVSAAGLEHHGVELLGNVATGLPKVGIPSVSWGDVASILPVSLTVALICLGQTAATVRSFAAGDDLPDIDRDFLALGAGNVLAGFAGSFPVDASPARTAVVSDARGRTQVACIFAAVLVALASPAANVLRFVPLATLAAILVFVASRLVKVSDLKAIARFRESSSGSLSSRRPSSRSSASNRELQWRCCSPSMDRAPDAEASSGRARPDPRNDELGTAQAHGPLPGGSRGPRGALLRSALFRKRRRVPARRSGRPCRDPGPCTLWCSTLQPWVTSTTREPCRSRWSSST